MTISELKFGDKKVVLTAFVKDVGEILQAKSGIDYQRLTLTDDTGETTVTLFGEECGKIPQGAWIECKNCYCTEYGGNVQFNKGKWGSITVVETPKKEPRPASKSTNIPETPTGGSNNGSTAITEDILADIRATLVLLNENLAQGFKSVNAWLADIKIYLHDLVGKK